MSGLIATVPELIALGGRVKHLKLDFTAGARSILAGAHRSRFRGRGMDFAESRHYQPGDDVRHIDWRVTARTGSTHTKLYSEERERPVFVVMDFGPSMYFGTRGAMKSVTASRAAACVAWSVTQGGDRIGVVLATPAEISEQRPAAGRRGVLGLVRRLHQTTERYGEFAVANSGPRLASALQHAVRVVHPGSLVVVFSDFYQQDEQVRKMLTRLGLHNDLVACQVLDRIECSVPAAGRYLVTDGRSRQVIDTRSPGAGGRYLRMIERRDVGLDELLRGLDIPLLRLTGDEPLIDNLVAAFGQRRGSAPRTRIASATPS